MPIKGLKEENLSFTLVPKDTRAACPVATGGPFEPLDQLDTARLEVNGGGASIILDSAPDQPDNDPIP